MAEATNISVEKFLAALKQQGPVSALISAAKKLDVDGVDEEWRKALAKGIKDFAGTKNGPMLIMGLPGAVQALLSFSGTVMPGLDRLGYLKASPRQVVNRLLNLKDEQLLAKYPFDKIGKADWTYYLKHCKGTFIAPFIRFLKRTEEAGGFSDREIGAAVLANREMVNSVPLERIDPDSAAELIVTGTTQPLWQKYDFTRFTKEHWRKVLENLNAVSLPKPCEKFLSNEDGKGFSNDELIELAYHCDSVAKWIDPDETPFQAAYDLHVKGKAADLWKRFPFSGLKKSEWKLILTNPQIDIPSALVEAINFGMFSIDDLCAFAVKNHKVFPFVGIESIAPGKVVDLLLACDAKYLWDHYPFARLSASDWERLICGYKGAGVVPHAELLGDSEGLSKKNVSHILRKNDAYLKFLPLAQVEPDLAIDLLTNGRHDELWTNYDFSQFDKGNWQSLFSKSDRIPVKFAAAVKKEMFSVSELCDLAKKNVGFIDFIPLEKLSQTAFVDLFLETRSKKLWNGYDFSRLTGPGWKRLICSLKTKGIVNTANHIKTATGLTTEIVSSLIKINPGYYKYVPVELISTDDVIKVLLSGECEPFWNEYPFERFSKADWVLFFTKTDRVPASFDAVVKRDVFTLGELCDYARQNESMVAFLPVAKLNSETLTDLLILSKTNILWKLGNLRRLTADCWVRLIQKRKPLIPVDCLKALKDVKGLKPQHVGKILEVDRRYYRYVPSDSIPADHACLFFSTGYADDLWGSYDFRAFTDEQIRTIVAKSPEREKWPKEIADKFSSAKESFSDNEILSLAEKNIVNVVELLTPKRIQQSGEVFFGKICDAAKKSKPAVSAITRKLTIGHKPWLELRQEYQCALLAAIPLCRKFVAWQELDLKYLDKLLTADKAFKDELRGGRKFKLFVWRHWLFLTIVALIAVCVSYRAVSDYFEQVRIRLIEARQAAVIETINNLNGRGDYEGLERYVNLVSNGEDAHLLRDSRTAEARTALEAWQRKRAAVRRNLDSLKQIAADGWNESSLDAARSCLASLDNSDVILSGERSDVVSYRRAFDARESELARLKKNEKYARQIVEIEQRCRQASTVKDAQDVMPELEAISADPEIDDENDGRCAKARGSMYAHVEALFKRELSGIQKKIDAAATETELDVISASVNALLSSDQVGEDVKKESNALVERIARRKDALREAVAKAQVEWLHKEVARLRSRLWEDSESEFLAVESACPQLKSKASFARYRKEYAEEYDALGADVQKRRSGINRAGAALAKANDALMSAAGVKAIESDAEKCSEILRELESWQKECGPIVKWKKDEVEQWRQKISDLCNGLKERMALVSAINGAKEYGTLYESIQNLLNKYPDSFECQRIDASRILDESQVKSTVTKSGWFSSEVFCEFVGVIKVCPKNAQDVVPLLNKDVASDADIYCVCPRYDDDSKKWSPAVRKIFTRTARGGFRKVGKIDYDRCQGVGLFICKDPSYVDVDSWTPGEENSIHRHWFASSKPGVWVEEPGYVKTSVFGAVFSEVEWRAHKTYLDGTVRTGDCPGEWQKRVGCLSCSGSGKTTHSTLVWKCSKCKGSGRLQRKLKCEKCYACNWRGYQWSQPFTCTECRGVGKRYDYSKTKCMLCSGKGYSWADVEDDNEVSKILERIKQEA